MYQHIINEANKKVKKKETILYINISNNVL